MIKINISQLQYSCVGETHPALAEIPAMQRRRLSSIAKLAFNSAIQSLNGGSVDYIVWASQYGDEAKTFSILQVNVNEKIKPRYGTAVASVALKGHLVRF